MKGNNQIYDTESFHDKEVLFHPSCLVTFQNILQHKKRRDIAGPENVAGGRTPREHSISISIYLVKTNMQFN